MNWTRPTILGRSGVFVSRIGIGASYGVGAEAIERAFHESGVNTFSWGPVRRAGMRDAVRRLAAACRDRIVVALQTYDRSGILMAPFVERGLVRALAISGHDRALQGGVAADPETPFDVVMVRYGAAHRGAGTEVLPFPTGGARLGAIAYTATRWGRLLDPRRMPEGERPPRASDCYGVALTDPRMDRVLAGPADAEQLDAALATLTRGPLSPAAMERMRRIGDHVGREAGRA